MAHVVVTKVKTIDVDNVKLLAKIKIGNKQFETNLQYNVRTNSVYHNDTEFEQQLFNAGLESFIDMDMICEDIESRKIFID